MLEAAILENGGYRHSATRSQSSIAIENHDLQIHTIPTIYHTMLLHQNCHEITYAPGLYFAIVQNLLAKTTQFGRHLD